MKILLVGGGSGGPVAPLLAVAEEIKKLHPHVKFLLVGTKHGPERAMAQQAGIPFVDIPAGKLRRYFSLKNLYAPIVILAGFIRAVRVLRNFKPHCVFAAGSFVQVPVIWAARILKIPSVIHQQDILPSLSNSLCQFAATKITVSFPTSLRHFSSSLGLFYKKRVDKIILTGNPFREKLKAATKEQALKYFHLHENLPVVFVLGGGTGAEFINKLVFESLPRLTKVAQVIHSTGSGKRADVFYENYRQFEFIDEIGLAYAAADIVVCRAGFSTITELSNLKKVAIVVPLPGTHQELNAYLLLTHKAALIAYQDQLSTDTLLTLLRKLMFDYKMQETLKKNISEIMPKNSSQKIAKIILELIQN